MSLSAHIVREQSKFAFDILNPKSESSINNQSMDIPPVIPYIDDINSRNNAYKLVYQTLNNRQAKILRKFKFLSRGLKLPHMPD